jgi:hypothetical protein
MIRRNVACLNAFLLATYLLWLQKFTDESLVFQEKILTRSGLGQKTYLPPAVACTPPCPSMQAAREEFETIMFSTVQDLLDKTGGCQATALTAGVAAG